MTAAGPVPGRFRVAIVAANTFEFESRLLKTAQTLAGDGHSVTVVAFAGDGLPAAATIGDRVELRRVALDRQIASGLKPLPRPVRAGILRAAGLPAGAEALPVEPARGADRLRAPIRRGLEILATVRRGGEWADAVARAAPDAEIAHAKALIALPVARRAVRRTAGRRGRFVYDVADLHTESARLVKLPGALRALVRRREGRLVREAAGVLAATTSMAGEVARRFHVPPPVVLLNCPPAWHPETPGPIDSDRLAVALGLPGRSRSSADRPLPGGVPGRPGDRGAGGRDRRSGIPGDRCDRRVPRLRPARAVAPGGGGPPARSDGGPARRSGGRAARLDGRRRRRVRGSSAAHDQPAPDPPEQAVPGVDGRRPDRRRDGHRALPADPRRGRRPVLRRRFAGFDRRRDRRAPGAGTSRAPGASGALPFGRPRAVQLGGDPGRARRALSPAGARPSPPTDDRPDRATGAACGRSSS